MKKVSFDVMCHVFDGVIGLYDEAIWLEDLPELEDWQNIIWMENYDDVYDLIKLEENSKEQIEGVIRKMMLPGFLRTMNKKEISVIKDSVEYYIVLHPEWLRRAIDGTMPLVDVEDEQWFFLKVWEIFFPGEKINWDIKEKDYVEDDRMSFINLIDIDY